MASPSPSADQLGRGQVWTGAQALAFGLVDKLGGLCDALDEAARRGNVPVGRAEDARGDGAAARAAGSGSPPGRRVPPMRRRGPAARRRRRSPPARLLTPELRAALRVLAPVLLRGNGSGYQARLPYDIEMR